MAVSLAAEPGDFDIDERSLREQLVRTDVVKGTPLEQHDFGKWMWVVTPRRRGRHQLYVKISAAIKDSRGLPVASALPDKTFPITVNVRVSRVIAGIVSRGAAGIVWVIISTLVGAFTKDYWWPIIRKLLEKAGLGHG
jgi:hypothetical protein